MGPDGAGGRGGPSAPARPGIGLALLYALAALVLVTRDAWTPRVPDGQLVEVTGAVARPGLHVVDPPTLLAAVEAAGGLPRDVPATPLAPGQAVHVGPDGASVVRTTDPLLVGLRVDLDADPAEALAVVPGIGPSRAEAVVADRAAQGPFRTVAALDRVKGLGRGDTERVRPFVTASEEGRPLRLTVDGAVVDLNLADADALQRLPGIGPTLAARVVASRAEEGPFRGLDDLERVSGIGPATVARLRALQVPLSPVAGGHLDAPLGAP